MNLTEQPIKTSNFFSVGLATMIVFAGLGLCRQASARTGGPDVFGYTFKDQAAAGGPVFQWVEIAPTGKRVLAAAGNPEGLSDQVATVPLDGPVFFYGEMYTSLRVSRHGYLSTSLTDDGSDASNDATLPTLPSNSPGAGNRYYVLHDNLTFTAASGVYYQYFSESPYAAHAGAVHIFQWNAVAHTGTPGQTFAFQALLFVNGDILFQFAAGNTEKGSGSTTGIQRTAQVPIFGLLYAANTANSVPAGTTVLFAVPKLVVTTAVDEDNVVPGTGLSLREAVAAAPPGATITFDPTLSGATIHLGTKISVSDAVCVDGSELASPPVIEYAGFSGGPLAVQSLIFSQTVERAITVTDYLYANDCDFIGLQSSLYGSAIFTIFESGLYLIGTIRVDHCRFENNDGKQGAAIRVDASTAVVVDSSFTGNTADAGGAIYSKGSNLTLLRCLFDGNRSGASGGGLYVGNPAGGGYPLLVDSCTFSGNSAVLNGGAIGGVNIEYSFFRRCTIYGNSTENGFAVYAGNAATLDLEFSHCAFGANAGPSNVRNYGGAVPTATDHNIQDNHDLPTNGPGDRSDIDLRLGPLSWNGGSTRTHMPLVGSPLIDAGAAAADTPAVDARGLARVVDGDQDGQAAPDVGACEAGPAVVVATLDDEEDSLEPYSLREAVAMAAEGGRVLFSPALNGGVISLSATDGGVGTQIELTRSVMIDATGLPDGITVDGGDAVRLFMSGAPHDVSFHAMTLRHGYGYGSSAPGAAVRNIRGNVTFNLCALHNNHSTQRGGAIYTRGGSVTVENSTLTENQTDTKGGALADDPSFPSVLRFRHCTLYQNHATSDGGALALGNSQAQFYYSILAFNTSGGSGPNVNLNGTAAITSLGYNLESGTGAGFTATGDQQSANPQLHALADNGGYSPTCALLSGSPARDVLNTHAPFAPRMDQRGFSRAAYPTDWYAAADRVDIGAYEASGESVDTDGDQIPDWWEGRMGLDVSSAADAALDQDGDGHTAFDEYVADTDPFDAESVLKLTFFELLPATKVAVLRWTVVPGKTYELLWNSDLGSMWNSLGTGVAPVGSSQYTLNLPGVDPSVIGKRFYKVTTSR